MGKPHPLELRERVVAFVEEGHSHRAAAAHLRVSPRFVDSSPPPVFATNLSRLVFIDETATNTKLTRRTGGRRAVNDIKRMRRLAPGRPRHSSRGCAVMGFAHRGLSMRP